MADQADTTDSSSHPAETNARRDAALRAELQTLARVNEVIVGTCASLERAKSSMRSVDDSVAHASALMESWTRILSRSEHNQRLLLDPAWNGASADQNSAESESRQRLRERQRKEAEDLRRREEAERKRAEDERKAAAASAAQSRVRGRGLASTRASRGAAAAAAYPATPAASAASNNRSVIARYGRVRGRGATTGRARAGPG